DKLVTGVQTCALPIFSDPPLSSVALDLERAGYESAQLLDGLMSGRIKEGYVVHVEPTHVVTRRSTDVIAQDDRLIVSALRFISEIGRASCRERVYISG